MKVLISEDNDYKFTDVEDYFNIKKCEITRTTSVKETLLKLKQNKYDILVQDMQLPMYSDTRRIERDGGVLCIEAAEHRKMLPDTVFIFSSGEIEENKERLKNSIIEKEVHVIKYSNMSNGWMNDFDKVLETL